MKLAFRVGNINQHGEGLWYDTLGNFTGYIHDKYNFCKCSEYQMPYREEMVNKLSITFTMETLFDWVSYSDMIKLADDGYRIEVYNYSDLNTYFNEEFQHSLIDKDYTKIIALIDPREFTIEELIDLKYE